MIDGVKSGQPKNQNKLVGKFLMTSKFILKNDLFLCVIFDEGGKNLDLNV